MKYFILVILMAISILPTTKTFAQLPVKPLASQNELLKSDNQTLIQNKKLVYDMWREFLEGGHLELADKYFEKIICNTIQMLQLVGKHLLISFQNLQNRSQ